MNARLFADMAPFHFQIEALVHHSVWGIEAVKTGVFAPPALIGAMPFADLQAMGLEDDAGLGIDELDLAQRADADDTEVITDRMTEEELLKGLEGLAPPEERPEPVEPDDDEE